MTQRWKPAADAISPPSHRISDSVEFCHIDELRGNGIVCGPRGILRGHDLIVETALIAAASNATRANGVRYCSVCCCFLGDPAEELARMAEGAKKLSSSASSTTSFLSEFDAVRCARAINQVASQTRFSANPLWFAPSALDAELAPPTPPTPVVASSSPAVSSSKHRDSGGKKRGQKQAPPPPPPATAASAPPAKKRRSPEFMKVVECYAQCRCDRCHRRALCQWLPQTLEECRALLEVFGDDDKGDAKPVEQLEEICSSFDEGVFNVVRAALMLLDEVCGGSKVNKSALAAAREKPAEAAAQAQQQKKDEDEESEDADEEEKSEQFDAASSQAATQQLRFRRRRVPCRVAPSSRLRQHSSCSSSRFAFLAKLFARSAYAYTSTVVAAAAAKSRSKQQQKYRNELVETFQAKVDFFCSCFDEGVMPTPSRRDIEKWRFAVRYLNATLNNVRRVLLEVFDPAAASHQDDDEDAPSWISLSQFFILRCCLQNNQHRSLITHPFVALAISAMSSSQLIPITSVSSSSSSMPQREVDECMSQVQKLLECFAGKKKQQDDEEAEPDDDDTSTDDKEQHPAAATPAFLTIEATALFNSASRLNHSCDPSACVEPSVECRGASIRVSARRNLEPGEEVRISYVDLEEIENDIKSVHERLRKWGFDCECGLDKLV